MEGYIPLVELTAEGLHINKLQSSVRDVPEAESGKMMTTSSVLISFRKVHPTPIRSKISIFTLLSTLMDHFSLQSPQKPAHRFVRPSSVL